MNQVPPPIARSPIAPLAPTRVDSGWEVSARRSDRPLRLVDLSWLTKLSHRADVGAPERDGPHPTPFGRARRVGSEGLEIGSDPGAWLVVSAPADGGRIGTDELAGCGPSCTVIDVTHGRALVRLSGIDSPRVLEKICAIDLHDSVTPNLAAFRSTVANLVTDVARDDLGDGTRSYLLHCDRSSGQFLFDSLLDAGAEFDIDIEGCGAI